ncbi:flagellar biosynthesis protein FlhB [Garciella nitratireducens]|uniref:Flagellar biosynthetic protein FliR n=1 Tax=Garciella nitratireducens DSM 15102 TaxID=1121911 RepID=A0A1T4LDE8_9FIRM|nr:flagellar biosynthesis protein FlhB [Garciella nitratireducens]SJZ52534.1 flagellar biosynthetic protein FliR/FlhB [Garciella nitratireducens DSM 15102]
METWIEKFLIDEFLTFFLILVRIISFMISSPLFRIKGIPNLLKIGFSCILSYLLYLTLPYDVVLQEMSLFSYGISVGKEVLFGLALGYIVNLIFLAIQIAGQMLDFQMGFSMATYYDPLTNYNVSLFGNLYYWLGMSLFFAMNGHYYLIYALSKSLELVPLKGINFSEFNLEGMVQFFSNSFFIAFQIAIPIMVILLLVDVIMGLLSRTVPQMNILMLGMPLKVLIGLAATIILLPALGNRMIDVIQNLPYQIDNFFKIFPFIFLFAAEEKTEEPTQKRIEDSRKKGQVAKSNDLNSAILLLLVVLLIAVLGELIFTNFYDFLKGSLENDLDKNITIGNIIPMAIQQMIFFIKLSFPFIIWILIVGIVVNIAQTGFIKSSTPLKPDFKRLNPIEGFKKIFSKKSLLEFLKNIFKLLVVGYVTYSFIKDQLSNIFSISRIEIQGIFPLFKDLVVGLMIRVGLVLLVLSVVDYMYQRFEFRKNLKMSKQEVKEEIKQMEGDPQVKSHIRQKQREIAAARMMAEVPNSTVIVTNPTHLAIALQYNEFTTGAPIVLAKGADYLAQKIRQIAAEQEIPIIENKPLAWALYQQVDIGQEIPMELYQAVAEILAMVYQMKRKSKFV